MFDARAAFANIVGGIFDQFRVYDTNDTLMIDGLDENDEFCLRVNGYHKTLYCVELSGTGTIPEFFSEENVRNIFNEQRNDSRGFMVWALVKKGLYHKNYVFTFSKNIANRFSASLDVKKLHAFEIINALYDLFLDNEYAEKNKTLVPMLDLSQEVQFENLSASFNSVVKEAVYGSLKDTKVYQGYKYTTGAPTNLYKLFQLDFTGVIFTYVNFAKPSVMAALDQRVGAASATGDKKPFKNVLEHYDNGEIDLAIINTVFLLKEGDHESIPGSVGNYLRTTFVRKNLFKKDLLRHTLIRKRDTRFDRLVDRDFFKDYFSMVHKSSSRVPDFAGVDIMGGFINYGFKYPTKYETNTLPHALFLGPSGSGKTSALGKIMSSMLRIDYETGLARNAHAKHFRLYDIKRSMRPVTDLLHGNKKNDVKMLSADLNHFSYNLINIATNNIRGKPRLDMNELAFAADLLSIILETMGRGSGGLTAEEDGIFKDAVKSVYENKKFVGAAISEIEESDPESYHRLKELGYSDWTSTTDTTEAEFEHLRKPILSDLMTELNLQKNNRSNDTLKQKSIDALYTKIDAVESLGYFSKYDLIDLKTGAYLYFDMDAVKDIPEYVPVFLAIFYKVYRADKKRQDELKISGTPRPEIYYIFEEANNLFSVAAFESMLKKLVFEARSYDIVLVFVLQRIEDVPAYVFSQIQSKIMMFRPKDKEFTIKTINEMVNPGQEIIDLFKATPQHGMTIWYEHGGFVMRFIFNEFELKLFESEGEKISEVEAAG